MIRKIAAGAALASAAAALSLAAPAHALDGASVEIGRGDERSELVRGALQWKWKRRWFTGGRWYVAGYWEASLGAWTTDKTLVDFGLTPVFRLQHSDTAGPYLEAAIGFHFLSDLSITRTRLFGSKFQFGDHLGAGWRFGGLGRYDLSVRLQHLSNGGFKKPNPGIDFAIVRFAYHFY
ncbi:MAG TPA: acyloxyacyl hydrolase [Burkholderiales bacterium]